MWWKKTILFVLCLLPVAWVVWAELNFQLGPDPGKTLVLFTGLRAIRFLLLALAITPIRQWTGWMELLRYRRLIGLFCYFYATLHFAAVFTYLLGWSGAVFIEEFSERPYMALGIIAWLLLLLDFGLIFRRSCIFLS